MVTVRDQLNRYTEAGVTVWGVTGHYPYVIAAWAKEHKFGVDILADYEHEVSEVYVGTYPPEEYVGLRHMTRRGVVSVGRDGKVRHVWVGEESGGPPPDDELRLAVERATV